MVGTVSMRGRCLGLAAAIAIAALTGCTSGTGAGDAVADEVSERCSTCHPQQFAAWQQTYHAKMTRAAPEGLLKEAVDHWVADAKGNSGPSKGNADGRTYTLADVELVVASKWKQRYLVKNATTGNHQFLDKQWNSYMNCWESYGNSTDTPRDCATCHAAATTG